MSEHWEGTPVTLARGSSPHRVRRLGKEVSVQQSGIEEVWKEVKLSGGSVLKNPPVMRETRVQSLGQEYPLEEDMATHSSILAWRIPMDRGAWWASVHGVTKSQIRLSD